MENGFEIAKELGDKEGIRIAYLNMTNMKENIAKCSPEETIGGCYKHLEKADELAYEDVIYQAQKAIDCPPKEWEITACSKDEPGRYFYMVHVAYLFCHHKSGKYPLFKFDFSCL